jgi:hypothetical protein
VIDARLCSHRRTKVREGEALYGEIANPLPTTAPRCGLQTYKDRGKQQVPRAQYLQGRYGFDGQEIEDAQKEPIFRVPLNELAICECLVRQWDLEHVADLKSHSQGHREPSCRIYGADVRAVHPVAAVAMNHLGRFGAAGSERKIEFVANSVREHLLGRYDL